MRSFQLCLLSLLTSLAAAGCGSSGGAACDSDHSGVTTGCGSFTCSAGQYCEPGFPSVCKNGCTSDSNCGPTDRCVRCNGAAVGTCQPCDTSDAEACRAPDAAELKCVRDTSVDQQCQFGPNGPRPPVGYMCPDTMTVPSDPRCVLGDLPIDWCCPM